MSAESPEQQAWEGKPAAESMLQEANDRIRQAENFAWTVPSLAIAAEAFLLAAALNRNASPRHQAIACLAGIVILLAALHFLLKHAFNFRVYEAVMERARAELGLPSVAMRQLVGSANPASDDEREHARAIRESFPAHVELVCDHWLDPPRGWRLLRRLRNRAARRWRATHAWAYAILALLVIDIAILIRATLRILGWA